jgi:hypothetical protein
LRRPKLYTIKGSSAPEKEEEEVTLSYLLYSIAVWYRIPSKNIDCWRFQVQFAAVIDVSPTI